MPKSHEQTLASCEKVGEGVNSYFFWVCNNPLAPVWTCLPEITPEHVNTARRIKKLFTGNLEEKIYSVPAFQGTEKHYVNICNKIVESLALQIDTLLRAGS